MVVIAIIAVLIGILLPSLKAVRIQTKVAASTATLRVLETGIQQFQADSRCGGALPPSAAPLTTISPYSKGVVDNPHVLGRTDKIDGSSLLFWALAGADQLGTPGFQDVDGNGTWANNTGLNGLYAIYPHDYADASLRNKPVVQRTGPFIELSKMKLPQPVNPTDLLKGFAIPAAVTGGHTAMNSLCFLDNFDQPILYYRANPNKSFMADDILPLTGVPEGTFNLTDNAWVTGAQQYLGICPGMNFGKGRLANGMYHYAGTLGAEAKNQNPQQTLAWLRMPAPDRPSFAYTIWNPNVTAAPRPYNEKSYLLISAGPDGVFGTPDDVANFEVNK